MNVANQPLTSLPNARLAASGVHCLAQVYRKGTRLNPHSHRESQLVFAITGTMQVTTPKGRWLVPPGRAVWVPARLPHAIDVLADIEMRTLYFDLDWLARDRRDGLDAEFVVRVSRLLREAVLALFDDADNPVRADLLIRLIVSELHHAEDPTTFVPLPQESRCRRAADLVLADPAGSHDIDDLARAVGTSSRTLSRLFSSETQINFKSWCQRARIAAAIETLAMDSSIALKQLSANLGYASVSAFSQAFRQVTGKTPREFISSQ